MTQPDSLRPPDTGAPGTSPAKDAFIMRLRKLYRDCMRPSYRTLARISAELTQLYPEYRGTLPLLSPAAICEILTGKRRGLPSPEWVASFVLSCQQWAWKNHVINDDPGPSSLPALYAALRAAGQVVAAAPSQPAADAAPACLCPPSTVQLTPAQREVVESYGPPGQALAGRLRAGEPEAVYRVALLLATVPAHVRAAHALLLQAAAAYHSAALELLDTSSAGPSPLEAASHAYRLADAAEASASRQEARMYYECAARAGHAAASLKLAIDSLGQHDEHQIAAWLAAIADQL